MTPLLSAAELIERVDERQLPQDATAGGPDFAKVELALQDATGIIVTHLPWLLKEDQTDVEYPLPAQYAEGLLAICQDIAYQRLTETVTDDENTRLRYKESLKILRYIDEQQQGFLSGGAYEAAEAIDFGESPLGDDSYFFSTRKLY